MNPILIDKGKNVIAGHGRIMAARKLGMEKVPVLYIEGLTEEQKRAYILADNRLTEMGGWDKEILTEELAALVDAGFDIELTGFDIDMAGPTAQEEKEEEFLDPTALLPDSKLMVCSISAFGTNTEKFIEITLTPETASHILKRAEEMRVGDIAEKLREALNDL